MKLGDLIREYRDQHDLSQRQFADICGLSNGYISMLERGLNPNTQKPLTPTLPQLKKLATGMSMSVAEMIDKVDDMPVDLSIDLASQSTEVSAQARRRIDFSLNSYIVKFQTKLHMLQSKYPQVFEQLEHFFSSLEEASYLFDGSRSSASSDDFSFAIISGEEKQLLNKYRQLDDRGRAAVRNTLDYEFASSLKGSDTISKDS